MKTHAPCTLVILAAMGGILLAGTPGYSYLPDFTAPGPQMDRWDFTAFPVTWNLDPAEGGNVTGSNSVASVMQTAFDTWTSAPNATLPVARGPDSSVTSESMSPPDINLICFVCMDGDFSKDSNTLAVTTTTTANAVGEADGHGGMTRFVGQLIKADIVFNPSVSFTTGGTKGQDLLTVATHEAGHFFGMDHSAVVRAVMFPAASSLTTLSYDDVAGISQLYPKSTPDVATGSISGQVTLNGAGVFGANVFAESVTGNIGYPGNIRNTPIGGLTRPDGTYNIQGVPADAYVVAAEPLLGAVSNSDVSGYSKAFGQPSVQTNFTARWH
ncbi:MAG TPA: matrixin family metalloprotease [Terriglobales bacterium]|nr:matrixin family metalloprotease [Terriglobales bacterium]